MHREKALGLFTGKQITSASPVWGGCTHGLYVIKGHVYGPFFVLFLYLKPQAIVGPVSDLQGNSVR